MPPRKRVRLVWSLLAVLLATSLVPLFVTAYALIDINQETLESATREYQLQVAGSLASRLDAAVSGGRALLNAAVTAVGPRVRAADAPDAGAIRALLTPYLSSEVVILRYTSATGSIAQVGEARGLDAGAVQDACFEAFATAVAAAAPVVVPVRLAPAAADHGPRPGAVIAAPAAREGAAAGVFAAVVDLTDTWNRGVNDVGADYALFAIDPNGGILASANLQPALADGTYRRLDIVERFLSTRGGIKEARPLTLPGGGLARVELLGASVPTDLGWGLFVLVDRDLAYHSAAEMRSEIYRWALFAIALAVIAAVVAAGLITRPLKSLVDGARSLARGEFGKPVGVSSRSEIGELAETFNFMSEEIQNHIQRIHSAADENQQLFLGAIRAFAAAIDEKDPYTRGHSERVHRYSVAVARHMGLGKTELRDVTVAALLHDVGKIGIEDAILRKPAALTDKEFEIMKRHPEKGSHIMESIPQMRPILGGIRNHHERWSGGGYPDNLTGEKIPLIARIVQVADTFDAMTTTRPYQRAMKMEAGVARIRELSGIVFDPKVVEAFQEAWVAGDIKPDIHPPAKGVEAPAPEADA
ncbi:MAG: HD domain-containing protein [Acidobacteria bacterium]|nr:HD domain-containing protein [Acidobacteriota bacterium]